MRRCEAVIAIRVKGGPFILYPEELNSCRSMSPDQCGGDLVGQGYCVTDVLQAKGLSQADIEPILGTSTPCKKYPHLTFGDVFPQ